MKIATIKTGLASLAMLPGLVMAAPAVADKADNAFMMICTALVLFMTVPGIALFYGGLIRGKNVLSMLTQVTVTFALVCILWVVYGYSLAFGEGNNFFGNINGLMLKNIELTAVMGSIYQYIHVAFQGSFACITVGLIVGALAERIRFSAVLIFVVVWLTLSYIPIAHMVISNRHINFYFWQKVDAVFRPPVQLGMSFLTPETFHFGDGQALNTNGR